MKSGFRDALEVKNQKPKNTPVDGKNSPWDWRAPEYDQRSSCFIQAGNDYGVGHTNPVGTKRQEGRNVVPMGRVDTMKTRNY